MRRRGAEGQRAHRAQAAAPVPHQRGHADDKALQRFRRRRRLCGHWRAGGRPFHRFGRRAQKVRWPGRHRAGHFGKPGAHGRGGGGKGRRRLYCGRKQREPRGHQGGRCHGRAAPCHALEGPRGVRYRARIFEFQRCRKACTGRAGCPAAGKGTGCGRNIRRKNAQPGGRPERVFEKGPFRTVRFHHRRGHCADALRRAPPAHTHPGHGR